MVISLMVIFVFVLALSLIFVLLHWMLVLAFGGFVSVGHGGFSIADKLTN